MVDLSEKLANEILESPWHDLAPHAARDRVIVVSKALDLLNVALAIAENDTVQVSAWMRDGGVRKPTASELQALETDRSRPFRFVICQPWVLIQELDTTRREGESP